MGGADRHPLQHNPARGTRPQEARHGPQTCSTCPLQPAGQRISREMSNILLFFCLISLVWPQMMIKDQVVPQQSQMIEKQLNA